MIAATRRGDVIVKRSSNMFAGTDVIPRPSQNPLGLWTTSGRRVSVTDAAGLPAAMASIRLYAETTGSLPMVVYRELEDESKERARDTWQWELLHDRPNQEQSAFGFYSYLTACLQGWGGAFALKSKSLVRTDKRVLELLPIEPVRCQARVQSGELVVDVRSEDNGKTTTLTRADVLYIPCVLFDSPYIGISPVTLHRNTLGTAIAASEFYGRFFANDATPGLVITASEGTTKAQRDEARDSWQAQHRGTPNSHKSVVLPNGYDVKSIGISPQDAQYIEGQRFNVEEVARMFRLHAYDIGGADDSPRAPLEEKNQRLLTFAIGPNLARIEQALATDADLFPDPDLAPGEPDLFCKFLPDGLLRADIGTRYAAYVQARQAGWLSANEIRAKEDLPPIEGGDEIQQTPVGGAPNHGGSGTADEVIEPAEPAT
jgi:HK97 family phage portal protein